MWVTMTLGMHLYCIVEDVCVCVFEVLTHQWFVTTAKLLEVLKVSLSRKNQPKQ